MPSILRFYSKNPQNRVTVVADATGDTLKFAVARTSDKDNFNRKIGRAIAEGRLEKGCIVAEVPVEKESLLKTFVNKASAIADMVAQSPESVHNKFQVC